MVHKKVILNKIDLADKAKLKEIEWGATQAQPNHSYVCCQYCKTGATINIDGL
jgi:hypothetical protein